MWSPQSLLLDFTLLDHSKWQIYFVHKGKYSISRRQFVETVFQISKLFYKKVHFEFEKDKFLGRQLLNDNIG